MLNSLLILAETTIADPSSVKDPLPELLKILFWAARIILLFLGGGGGLFMIVKGKSEDNPRDTQEGYLALIGTGVLVAATFAIQTIFK